MEHNKLINLLEEYSRKWYEIDKRGAFDFPDEEDWIKEEVHLFKLNNPELFGYVWDDENQDWIKEEKELGRMYRMVDRTGNKQQCLKNT